MVPDPHELKMLVIPNIIEKGVDEAVLTVLNKGPPPPALGTAHARRPIAVEANATEDMMNGRCSRSGGTSTSGMYMIYQITTPTRSCWVIWEDAGSVDGWCFQDGLIAPSILQGQLDSGGSNRHRTY